MCLCLCLCLCSVPVHIPIPIFLSLFLALCLLYRLTNIFCTKIDICTIFTQIFVEGEYIRTKVDKILLVSYISEKMVKKHCTNLCVCAVLGMEPEGTLLLRVTKLTLGVQYIFVKWMLYKIKVITPVLKLKWRQDHMPYNSQELQYINFYCFLDSSWLWNSPK